MSSLPKFSLLGVVLIAAVAIPAPVVAAPTGRPGFTQRVSVGAGSAEAHDETNDPYNHAVSVSADGRFVAFSSRAGDLVPGDTNAQRDVFVHDRLTGVTERVSVRSSGAQASGSSSSTGMGSTAPSISADGRYVAFMSEFTTLVATDGNGAPDIFVHDRQTDRTEAVSVGDGGVHGDNWSRVPSISSDGRFVAFDSAATNLVASDTNGDYDVFVHDRETKQNALVSNAADGTQGDGVSYSPAISGDGAVVAFYSQAANLVAGDTNGYSDVFVAARTGGSIQRVSIASDGVQANDQSYAPSISDDGRLVAFISKSSNLVPTDLNGTLDAFVHDRTTGRTRRLTVTSAGASHDDAFPRPGSPYEDLSLSATRPRVSLSPDGRFAGFVSRAGNLGAADANGLADVFVRDLATGATERVSVTPGGGDANGASLWAPAISAGGGVVAFASDAANLVPGDTNGERDVFVRDRGGPIGVVGLRAERSGADVVVSGAVTASGVISDASDEAGDVDLAPEAAAAGLDLVRASVVWRPESEELFFRWEATEMPSARGPGTGGNAFEVRSGIAPSAGGTPGVTYETEFRLDGVRYFVQVNGGPVPEARLFDCTAYPCTDLGAVQGSLGSAGVEAHAVVPAAAIGLTAGEAIAPFEAAAGFGDDRALVFIPENVDIPGLAAVRPRVEVGIGPAGSAPEDVTFQPAPLTGNGFSATRPAPAGGAVAWVRVCLGTDCSLSAVNIYG